MKTGKICFIHFRNASAPGVLSGKGGATVAYRLAENGDVMVAEPAVCSVKDNYNKAIGRQLASQNMFDKPMAIVLPASTYVLELRKAIELNLAFTTLTRKAQSALIETALGLLDDDIHSFVNSGWFESMVTSNLHYDGTNVYVKNGKVFGAVGRGASKRRS